MFMQYLPCIPLLINTVMGTAFENHFRIGTLKLLHLDGIRIKENNGC